MAARIGASAIGVDVNPHCLRSSRRRATAEGLETFIEICDFDLTQIRSHPRYAEATVLYLYLMHAGLSWNLPGTFRCCTSTSCTPEGFEPPACPGTFPGTFLEPSWHARGLRTADLLGSLHLPSFLPSPSARS